MFTGSLFLFNVNVSALGGYTRIYNKIISIQTLKSLHYSDCKHIQPVLICLVLISSQNNAVFLQEWMEIQHIYLVMQQLILSCFYTLFRLLLALVEVSLHLHRVPVLLSFWNFPSHIMTVVSCENSLTMFLLKYNRNRTRIESFSKKQC